MIIDLAFTRDYIDAIETDIVKIEAILQTYLALVSLEALELQLVDNGITVVISIILGDITDVEKTLIQKLEGSSLFSITSDIVIY